MIYLDYASTTPVDPRVSRAMEPFWRDRFANPASLHEMGQDARRAVEEARTSLAHELNCRPKQLIFTSSATESNNLALKGVAFDYDKGHILVSDIEHKCVLESARWLGERGFEVETARPEEMKERVREDTVLVSLMHGNNETGLLQPVRETALFCREKDVPFHTDAAQTMGKLKVDVKEMGVDLLTGSSHKMYGPKGVGLLYVRDEKMLTPLLHGGGQERGLRSSTLNVPGIVGLAEAVKVFTGEREEEAERVGELKGKLTDGLVSLGAEMNGDPDRSLYNIVNVRFEGREGADLVLELSARDIFLSTGSACTADDLEPSHVLKAMGLTNEQARASVRFSLGRWSTAAEVERVLGVLEEVL